jgi:PAS domain S-box-containing protein
MKSKKKPGVIKKLNNQTEDLVVEMSAYLSPSVEFKDMYITRAYEISDLFGFRPDELVGVSIGVLFTEFQEKKRPSNAFLSEIISGLSEGNSVSQDLNFQHRHGYEFKEGVKLIQKEEGTFVMEFSYRTAGMMSDHLLENLAKRDSKMGKIDHQTPFLIRMSNDKNEFYYFSKQWLQYTGSRLKDELNDGWLKHVHPDDKLVLEDSLKKAFKSKSKYDLTYRLFRHDKQVNLVCESGIPLYDNDGMYMGYIATAIEKGDDISQLKKRKIQDFLESEKKLQESLNYSNLISLTINRNQHVTYCNDNFTELLGLEKEAILGEDVYSFLEFIDPDGKQLHPVKDLFDRKNEARSIDAFLRSSFREKSKISFSSILLYDEEYDLPSITLVGENITEKMKVTHALQESNQQLKNLFDSANDLIQIASPDGNFLFVNKTWKDKLGYTNDDIPNLTFNSILDESARESMINKMAEMSEENNELKVDTILKTKDGDKVFVTGNLNCTYVKGKKKECRGIFYDVTERLKAEKAQNLYYSISNLTFNTADLDSLFIEIHNELQKIVTADNFYVALCDEAKTYIQFPYFKDNKSKEVEEFLKRPFGEGLTEYAITNQKPVFYTEKDLLELQEKKKLIIHGSLPKVWLGVPLKQGGNIIGIIVVQSYTDKKTYSRKDLDLLVFISSQIATAIDRQQKQIKIREQSARMHSIFESGDHMIWSVDRALLFSSYNRNFSEFLKGNYMMDSKFKTPPKDINEINRTVFWELKYSKAFEGKSVQFELKFINHKTKKVSWKNIILNPIFLEDNVIEEVSGIAYDITDKKLSEIALTKSEEQFRDIFESFQDVYFRCSFDGEITMLSPSVKEFLGYEADELIGKDITNYYLYSKKSKDLLKNLVRVKSIRDFEAALIHKDSRIIQSLCNLRLVYDNKMESVVLEGVARDITKLKETNIELKQAKEVAERSLKVKELFLANMSHEIRTPMNGIIGMIDLMEGTSITPDQKHYIQTIKKSSETLLNILNDILDLSKIEAGKMQLKPEPVKLRNTMDKIYALFAQQALAKNINLYYHLSEKLPEYVLIDETRLLQILSNLISNAIKFTEGGGSIDIDLKKARIPGQKNIIRCVVSDSGIGISPENIRRLFGIFSQIDNSTTKSYSGTGLGLAISKELARLMGGKIGVYSTLGLGSSFWFTFEAEPTKKTVIVENKIVDNDITIEGYFDEEQPKILLVDDNGVNRQVAGEILKKSGCIVTLVENGKRAIELAATNKYDLIFMDIQMPEMDGVTATRKIKEMKLEVQPPIVAMTAYSMKEDKERFLSQGLDDYIAKPIRANDLLNKVRQWVLDEQIFYVNGNEEEEHVEILNMDTVNQLIDLGGEEMVHQVFIDFHEETTEQIAASLKASKKDDYEEIRRHLHTLKGNAGTLGVEKLSKLAELIERTIKNENYKTLEEDLKLLNLTFEEFKNKFNQILKTPKDERP